MLMAAMNSSHHGNNTTVFMVISAIGKASTRQLAGIEGSEVVFGVP
jgi:hypothetical protein